MGMGSLLLAVIYLIFISLGLPDSLLGSGWPTMQVCFNVPSSYAGFVSMTISCMTVISALLGPRMIRRFHTKSIAVVSIGITVLGLFGFSVSGQYWMLFLFAVPYGLGAGARAGLSDETVASFGSLVFGGLMLGRLISGFTANKLGDRLLIRLGIALELLGILLVFAILNLGLLEIAYRKLPLAAQEA